MKKTASMLHSKSTSDIKLGPMPIVASTMKEMRRIEDPPVEKFPKYGLPNTSIGTSGLTFSIETNSTVVDSNAELEVLKAILNRESYLKRLFKMVKTLEKKFKPEVADLLDFIRAATIDVIESIVKWREVKGDHDATFMWNGLNYMLKMSSDLDYLVKYKVINEWIGFSIERNPFCVPFPLENGIQMFADKVLDPNHIEQGMPSDGFMLGGLTHTTMRKAYAPAPSNTDNNITSSPSRNASSRPISRVDNTAKSKSGTPAGSSTRDVAQSFVLNSDMRKIKQCELVILKEEEKFGRYSRDPDGRIVPLIQAKTRIAALELRKDDKRPIQEPSKVKKFAPHAAKSDIGVAPIPYVPEEELPDPYSNNEIVANNDDTVLPKERGEVAVGGILSELNGKGTETRPRRVIPPTLGSSIEFGRHRKKKTLGERLAEIAKLKEEILAQKIALEKIQDKEKRSQKKSRERSAPQPMESLTTDNLAPPIAVNDAVERPSSTGESEMKDSSTKELDDYAFDAENTSDEVKVSDTSSRSLRVQLRLNKINEDLQIIEKEENQATNELNHLIKDQSEIDRLKIQELGDINVDRSREIERRRRLLLPEEGKRTGPPPVDKENVYDYYSTRIQTCIRGWLARCWAKWYRLAVVRAAIIMQAVMRGSLVRWRTWKFKFIYRSVTHIQRVYRGYKARGASAKLAKNKNIGKSALIIQTGWRAFLGKRRVGRKKKLDNMAIEAIRSCDARTLFATDAKELARRILCAIEEPGITSYPPDEVLHLLRITIMIFQGTRGLMGFAEYDFINARYYKEVDGEHLTWYEASKMVNRSERFIRLLRFIAYGPGAKPPRLIQIPHNAILLFDAMQDNPNWKLDTFETMGLGSKLAVQMFKWVNSVILVSKNQPEFLYFIASPFPDWLPQLQRLQAESRQSDFNLAVANRTIDTIKQYQLLNPNDEILNDLLNKEIKYILRNVENYEYSRKVTFDKEDNVREAQVVREKVTVANMNNKLMTHIEELSVIAKKYKNIAKAASGGDKAAEKALPDARADLIHKELACNDYRSQFKLIKSICADNEQTRKNMGRLTNDLRAKAHVAGEAAARQIIAACKCQVMLVEVGVRHDSDLPDRYKSSYLRLQEEEAKCRERSKLALRAADIDRKEYDKGIEEESRKRAEEDIKSDKMQPNDAEMQEERVEDEEEARVERLKASQYLPDSLKVAPARPRPVIICLARDVPGMIKRRIISEVTRWMPGIFVNMDIDDNMGLNSDKIQAVLDSNHCVILHTDHGLTEMTRKDFMKNFDFTLRSLIPVPFVVMAIGNEENISSAAGGEYGVNKRDIVLSRDKDIKGSLETMSYILLELKKPDIVNKMLVQSTDVVPSSPSMVLVLETVFVVLSEHDGFFSPDKGSMGGSTWRLTQKLLADPLGLVEKLKCKVRGSTSFRRCECVHQYMQHRHWPPAGSAIRMQDIVLNLLSLYVEKWYLSEWTTLQQGGLPRQPLTKNLTLGIQTVIVVGDNMADPDTDFVGDNSNNGWRMPAAKLVRTALQDLRLLKTVATINGHKYHVCVYREANYVYLDAYDPVTSAIYFTSVATPDVPSLLVPDAFSISAGVKIEPPSSNQELSTRLVKLLALDRVRNNNNARKMLVCRREYRFMQNLTVKLRGMIVHIKAYEAALGELYFKAYIPQFSAHVELLMADDSRLKLLRNNDESIEGKNVYDHDARGMLPAVLDRLDLNPGIKIVNANGFDRYDGFKKQKAGIMQLIKSQGFKLKIRTKGGAGRLLKVGIVHFNSVPHILFIRVATASKLLRIILYEPRTRKQLEIRINEFMRLLIFKTVSDDVRVWYTELVKRLRMDWRGERALNFDTTILRVVRKILGRRVILTFHAIDEVSISAVIIDNSTSARYIALLTKETIIRLLLFVPDTDFVKKEFGLEEVSESIKNILVKSIENSKKVIKSKKSKKKNLSENEDEESTERNGDIDPATFDTKIGDILSHPDSLLLLAYKLQVLLKAGPASDDNREVPQNYFTEEPEDATVEFIRKFQPTNRMDIDTSIVHKPRLAQTIHTKLDVDIVLRNRKQLMWLNMEQELNDLALRKSQAALIRVQEDEKASEEIDQYLNTIEDVEELDSAIASAANTTTTAIMDQVEQGIVNRMVERANPGTTQEVRRTVMMMSANGKDTVEVDSALLTEEQREILGRGENFVCESGVKCTFRGSGSRWSGHVSIKVYETLCWISPEDGCGRRLRYIVYEPNTACYYEGIVRNSRHMREILGVNGQDLLSPLKTTEMVLFIAKYRMNLVKNDITWDGEVNDSGAPPYRVEFESVRIYDNTKVTPINANEDLDAEVNSMKVIDVGKLRGKKVLRLARRVSGLLMQLTVFELPKTEAELENDKDNEIEQEEENIYDEIHNSALFKKPSSEEKAEGVSKFHIDENMLSKTKIPRFIAPTMRVIGYDPKSKRKVIMLATPEMMLELAGGMYSPYLDPSRRRDLAKILCESLLLHFPRGKPFELNVAWSGAKSLSTAVASDRKGSSWRSSADRVVKRPGKIFRSAVRVSKLELLVTLYVQQTVNHLEGEQANLNSEKRVIFNFYSTAASEAAEVLVNEDDQIKRIGTTIMSHPDGPIRATVIRRFLRYFQAALMEDPEDMHKKILHITFAGPKKDFVNEYKNIGVPQPGEDYRPVGVPEVFLPLDTCGRVIHRRGMTMSNTEDKNNVVTKDYVVTIYTKSKNEEPERGLVIKLYERGKSDVAILHLGPSQCYRLVDEAGEPDLMRDIVAAKELMDGEDLDNLEVNFQTFTKKGDIENERNKLISLLCDIVLADLGVKTNPQQQLMPYIKSYQAFSITN